MTGYVYFFGCEAAHMVKIGHSHDPEKRLRLCQPVSPYPLQLLCAVPGDQNLERKIQNCFADYHAHHEWFFRGERLERAIQVLLAGKSVDDAIDLTDVRGNVLGMIQKATMKQNGTSVWGSRRATMRKEAAA